MKASGLAVNLEEASDLVDGSESGWLMALLPFYVHLVLVTFCVVTWERI